MKADVEWDMKLPIRNPLPINKSIMSPYGVYYHFIGIFCHKALTVKVKKNTC